MTAKTCSRSVCLVCHRTEPTDELLRVDVLHWQHKHN